MAMKILDLYESILSTAGMVVTSDGFVKMKLGESTKPATIKGKSLVMPTEDQLKNPDWDKRVVFHPLFENIMRPESDVLALYRQAANIRVNVTVGTLAAFLMRLATSPAEHGKLTPDQSEFLSKLKHADDKTMQALKRLMEVAPVSQPQKSFVHIYLKKTGSVAGKRYSRVGVVTFPLYNELKKEGDVFGVKLRVKDRETLQALMEYIFPGIDEAETYNRGSNSEVAPSIDVMMKTIAAIADPLNGLLELMQSMLDSDDFKDMVFQNDWMETFENLAIMLPQIRSIPMQAGNDGAVKPASEAPAPVAASPTPAFAPAAIAAPPAPWQAAPRPPVPQQPPMAPPAARPVVGKGGADFESFLQSNPAMHAAAYQSAGNFATQPRIPPQQPMYPGQPQPMGYQGQPYPGAPVYQQPPQFPYPPQQMQFYQQPQQMGYQPNAFQPAPPLGYGRL